MESFRFTALPHDGVCTLIVQGEIDPDVAPQLTQLGTDQFNRPNIDVVVIDLRAVTFMDSSGLSSLVQLRTLALSSDKHLSVTNIPPMVLRILQVTGLDSVFGRLADQPAIA